MIGPGQPGHTYDRPSIVANAPNASGVYAIYGPQRWIYVGESGDIQTRLLQHLGGENACITKNGPTGFAFELSPAAQRVARQNQLIAALNPSCNQRLG
jgi:hypothetical protein